jgi:RNA polymerase sigma-70 factor, ECF subfamily
MIASREDRATALGIVDATRSGAARARADSPAAAFGRARALDWSILMAHAQTGDGEAYRRLLGQVTPYLRSLARRYHNNPEDVEDAVQDILLTVHAIRRTYDPSRPFGPWLISIANRRLIDRLRRQGRQRAREAPLMPAHEVLPSGAPSVEEEVAARRSLAAAMTQLSHGQRQAIQLLKLQGLSSQEASSLSGMSMTALKVAAHRAMRRLRDLLSDER